MIICLKKEGETIDITLNLWSDRFIYKLLIFSNLSVILSHFIPSYHNPIFGLSHMVPYDHIWSSNYF